MDGGNTDDAKWYVVKGNQTLEERLEIYGPDVNIILAQNATLTVHGGVFIRSRTNEGKNCKLIIWASRRTAPAR
ncbi:MAG: hypothetical protein IJ087_00890 [Eggerthellaceae bacterium]|nr:hypothetical protein [Eggerthellaceae bacterium]